MLLTGQSEQKLGTTAAAAELADQWERDRFVTDMASSKCGGVAAGKGRI